jgi:starch synthase
LTQLCALRYGAVPIVSRVGGLEDTVVDANEAAIANGVATGFKFGPVTAENLVAVLRASHAVFQDTPAWRKIQKNGMSTDVSWRNRASRYAGLYRELIELRHR